LFDRDPHHALATARHVSERRTSVGQRPFNLTGLLRGATLVAIPAWRREPDVPQIEVSEKQILDSLERLSPEGRREAVLRLIAGASALDRLVETFEPGIVELAKERGLDWARLSDDERERLVDDILHE
jgi:hypothetical protein